MQMHYNAEDAVYTIRAQAHTSVLRTVHNKHVVRSRRNPLDRYVLAVLLPIFLTANFILYDQLRVRQNELLHLAAPEKAPVVVTKQLEEIDPSIEEQQEAMKQICDTVCWDQRIPQTNDKLVLINFCTDVCGIPFAEPVVEPDTILVEEKVVTVEEIVEKPVVIETKEVEVLTIDSIHDEAAIVESSLQAIEESLEKFPHDQVGMYLTQNSVKNQEFLNDTIADTKLGGGNAVIFDVKGSYVYFDADSAVAKELGTVRPLYDLQKIVADLHEKDIYVIARYIAIKDPTLAALQPETQIRNVYTGKGIGDVWVSPNHPKVLEYNKGIITEILKSDIDEINFDYIRFPTEYNQKAINLSGTQKADQLLEFLQMARDLVEESASETKIGVSTFAILGWNFPLNFEPLGQDIARFATVVDVISPMAYPSTFSPNAYFNPQINPGPRNYYLVYRTLLGYKELLGEHSWKLRPWIQGYYMKAGGMKSQIKAVHDAGLCGFTVWNAQNNYKNTYEALKGYQRPEHCS